MSVGQVWLVLESSSYEGPLEVVVRRNQRSFRTLHAREVLTGRTHCRECIQHSHRAQIWHALQLLDAGEPTESPTHCGAPALPTTRAVTSKRDQLEEWLALLDSPSVDERILAVQALLEARFAVAPRLVAGLRSQDDAAIAATLKIIQLIGGDSAPIEELSRLLDERRWMVPVLRAFGAVGRAAEPALALIEMHLLDRDPEIRQEALSAYSRIAHWTSYF